jgi:hypothetical protein
LAVEAAVVFRRRAIGPTAEYGLEKEDKKNECMYMI